MAAATVTHTEWGYLVTGDTDAVTVSTGRLRVKAIGFSGNADNATAVLTGLRGLIATSLIKFKTNADDLNTQVAYFGENGIPVTGLAVTLSNAADEVYIYLT